MRIYLTPADLQRYIDEHQIEATLIDEIGHTPTVPAAAAALGVEPAQIIKTLLFLIRQPGQPDAPPQPVVVISNGERRVEKKALATQFDVGKNQIKLASAEQVLELLGYPAGGVPPFGHRTPLPVLVDETVAALQSHNDGAIVGGVIYGGGGDDRTMMRLTVAELLRVVQPQVLALS
ncbi:MAG: hypothetical protein H6641_01715 [Caldilineaceae bacterium]|nr:hypothetical protein [Caldilineaceae bacterium]